MSSGQLRFDLVFLCLQFMPLICALYFRVAERAHDCTQESCSGENPLLSSHNIIVSTVHHLTGLIDPVSDLCCEQAAFLTPFALTSLTKQKYLVPK